MPEAPEIFYLKEKIKKQIKNHFFEKIVSNTKSVVNLPSKSKIIDIDCKGKLLWIITENYYVHIHMMISGWIVEDKPKICKYELIFDNITLYIDDRRRFSKIKIIKTKLEHDVIINNMGLSFLLGEVTKENFFNLLSNSHKNISALLLQQNIFCGIGNYIRNEVLYLIKVHPMKKSNTFDKKLSNKLYDKILYVMFSNLYELLLNDNINVPKYIHIISPKTIQIPYKFRVYEREKDNNNNIITREKIAGRWAYYVKKIQTII
jgi:formamidopyrimidine-DNA glycosylase